MSRFNNRIVDNVNREVVMKLMDGSIDRYMRASAPEEYWIQYRKYLGTIMDRKRADIARGKGRAYSMRSEYFGEYKNVKKKWLRELYSESRVDGRDRSSRADFFKSLRFI